MILFPPAKINLGLNVLFKRDDGYHELDTCMISIPLCDALEILPAKEFSFHQTGLVIPGNEEDNLCVRAYKLMVENFKVAPVYIHLRKEIPMGAGLGGGSANASFVLKGIKEIYKINCSDSELENIAAELGSDCPFFIKDEAQIAKGRGEVLSPCNVDLTGYFIKIIYPGIHVGTKEAYAGIVFGKNEYSIKEIVESPIETWHERLINDFEASVFSLHPELAEIKNKLYSEGAIYAAMSGSGSTLFGIYRQEPTKSFLANSNYLEVIKKF
jgi:4-diphosphocytidyl-2-C-methyl-D-erythritol kinase